MKKTLIILFFLLLAVLTACSPQKASFETITGEQAKEIMETETEFVLLDVREQSEFDEGHIAGAVLLPYEEITADKAAACLPNKNRLILVYCRSGRRSAIAAETLAGLGYANVKDFGGIIDWKYDIVTEKIAVPSDSLSCEENGHTWVEDCTGKTCSACGAYERVTQ